MTIEGAQRTVAPSPPAAALLIDLHGQGNLSTAAFRAPASSKDGLTSASAYRWVAFYHAPARVDASSGTDPEMRLIESDPKFYGRLVTRLNRPGRLIPAEEVLGDLDSDDDS